MIRRLVTLATLFVLCSLAVSAQLIPPTQLSDGYAQKLARVGNEIYFSKNYTELWKTDGSVGGTVQVATVAGMGWSIENIVGVNGLVFFTVNENQLWRTDGTQAGTFMLRQFQYSNSWKVLDQFTPLGGILYFNADDGAHGVELWRSDGTAAGTVMVKDINPQPADPNDYYSRAGWSWPFDIVVMNGRLYFKADDGTNGAELWTSDGTEAGTFMVRDITPGSSWPYRLAVLGNLILFRADTTLGSELWKSDGTSAGTVLVKDIRPSFNGSYPDYLTTVDALGLVFFAADDGVNGIELWKSDGTAAGTQLVKDIKPGSGGSSPIYLKAAQGRLYVQAADATSTGALYLSDGTAAGTQRLDLPGSTAGGGPYAFTETTEAVYFNAHHPMTERALWRTNGTQAGTKLVYDSSSPYGYLGPHELTTPGGTKLLFVEDDRLWVVNGCGQAIQIQHQPNACAGARQKATIASFLEYANINWTATNATIEGAANGRDVYFRSNGNGPVTLSVTAAEPNGCTGNGSVNIPLGPLPTPEIMVSYATICPLGYSSAYVFDDYSQYWWVVTNATNLTGQGTSAIQFDHVPSDGDVTVTLYAGEGACAVTATREIPVRETVTPIVRLGQPAICANSNGTIYIDNYNAFSYVSLTALENAQVLSVGTTSTFRATGGGNVKILLQADSNSCNMQQTIVVPLGTPPAKPTVSASGPTTFCAGGSVTLTANTSGGTAPYSYQWYHVGQPISGATSQTYLASPSGNDYYYVVVTDAAGCVSPSSDATVVTVNPNPNATITAPASACALATATASVADAGPGATYAWTIAGGTITGTMAGEVYFQPGASGNVVLNVTVTTAAGCSASDSETVAINPQPPADITASGPTTFCQGGSVTLSAPAGYAYLWSNNATTQSITVTAGGPYSVVVTSASGCSKTSGVVNVTVNPMPPATITPSGPTTFCQGGSVTLSAPAGYAYLWSNNETTQSITVTAGGPYTVVVSANGCSSTSAPTNVTVNPSTAITAQPQNVTMRRSEQRTLSVTATGTATLQYQWYEGSTGDTSKPAGTGPSKVIGPYQKKGTYRYWVRVSSTTCGGPVDSATAVVTVNN